MGRGGFPRQQEKRREARGGGIEENRGERGEGGKTKGRLEDQEKEDNMWKRGGQGERDGYHDNKGRGML